MIHGSDVTVITKPKMTYEEISVPRYGYSNTVRAICDGARAIFGEPPIEPIGYDIYLGRGTLSHPRIECKWMDLYDDKTDITFEHEIWYGVFPIVAHGGNQFTVSIDYVEQINSRLEDELGFSQEVDLF